MHNTTKISEHYDTTRKPAARARNIPSLPLLSAYQYCSILELKVPQISVAAPNAANRESNARDLSRIEFLENLHKRRIKIRRYGRERTSSIFTL